MEREVGGGIGMGNTCKPMADSFHCMTKPTTIKKKKNCAANLQVVHIESWSICNYSFDVFLVAQTVKESAYLSGDLGLIPGLGRSLGGGHGNPLQYSCLENPMDRGA